jgi:hypothetical protein
LANTPCKSKPVGAAFISSLCSLNKQKLEKEHTKETKMMTAAPMLNNKILA